MTRQGPPVDATTGWELLVTGRHSPQRWREILDAADDADRTTGQAARGGPDWCGAALAAADPDRLPATAADWYRDRIDVDADLLRRWLHAPVVDADGCITVADMMDVADLRNPRLPAAHTALESLVGGAQTAGLFGLSGATIEVHRIVDMDDWSIGQMLVARSEHGPGVATPVIPTVVAAPTGDRIEDAVNVLSTIAEHLNSTLDIHDGAVRSAADPTTVPARQAHPFPSLATVQAAANSTLSPLPEAEHRFASGRSR